ncbi:MAG: PGF-pre-PGF domain-containing protein, partial [Candidatus Aenigmarchaeota archaeon]|nr:PGF-pre-PGF domain-containing protein [Candidatus Aenigmarchaeota archaeon]
DSNADWWIKKFNATSGIEDTASWNKTFSSAGSDFSYNYAYSVAIDSSDNVYVTGVGYGLITGTSNFDWWIKKFNSTGSEDTINWNKTFAGALNCGEKAYSIAVDSFDNVYAAACGYNIASASSNYDWWIKKFTSTGVEDIVSWNKTVNSAKNSAGGDADNAYSILINDSNVYVVGAGTNLTGLSTNYDWWIKKFNLDGSENTTDWNKTFTSPGNNIENPYSIIIDSSRNVYVAGYGKHLNTSSSGDDWWIKKFNISSGEQPPGGGNESFGCFFIPSQSECNSRTGCAWNSNINRCDLNMSSLTCNMMCPVCANSSTCQSSARTGGCVWESTMNFCRDNFSAVRYGSGGTYSNETYIDFMPPNCAANPTSCSSLFNATRGFVVPEICDNGVDDNNDARTDCADPTCFMKLGCSYNASLDNTAPQILNFRNNTFNDTIMIDWFTDLPTNSSLAFFNISATCSGANVTYNQTFFEGNMFTIYKNDHHIFIDQYNAVAPYNIILPNTTYFYKLIGASRSNKTYASSCMNVTTALSGASKNVTMRFDGAGFDNINFDFGAGFQKFSANQSFIVNGSQYASMKIPFGRSVQMTFPNITLASAKSFNFSNTFFDANYRRMGTGFAGVGMSSEKFAEMKQALGLKETSNITMTIASVASKIYKCSNETAATSCTDVTNNVTIIGNNGTHMNISIPVWLGFSTYVAAGTAAIDIWDENDTAKLGADQSKLVTQNITFYANYTNASSNAVITGAQCSFNFTGMTQVNMSYNTTSSLYYTQSKVNATGFSSWSINCSATGHTMLNATDNLTLSAAAVPTIALMSPVNSYSNASLSNSLSCNATSQIELTNLSLYVYNSTNTTNITTISVSGSSATAVFNYTFPADNNYTWNCRAFDAGANSSYASSNRTIIIDTTAPFVTTYTPTTSTSSTATITLTTNENSTCRYSTTANTSYASMTTSYTGNTTSHTLALTSLTTGTYTYYTRCNDTAGNVNNTDYNATLTVTITAASTSSGGGGGGGSSSSTTKKSMSYSKIEQGSSVTISGFNTALGLQTVQVTAKNVVISPTFTLDKMNIKPAEAADHSADVYKYLNITKSFENSAISEVLIAFAVEKSWTTANTVDENKIALYRWTTQWDKLNTVKETSNATHIVYKATSPGLSYFMIAEVKEEAASVETPAQTPVEIPAAPVALCNNGIIDSAEECDGFELGANTCQTLGFYDGTLKCSECKYDTTYCEKKVPETVLEPESTQTPYDYVIIILVLAVVIAGGFLYYKSIGKKSGK